MNIIQTSINLIKYDKIKADESLSGKDDLADLARDILANGLINPVVISEDNVLVFGYRRFFACKGLGKKTIAAIKSGLLTTIMEPAKYTRPTNKELGNFALRLRKKGKTWREVSDIMNIPARTLQRYTKECYGDN